MMKHIFVFCAIFLMKTSTIYAWDSEELEIFDLVEEINENFYKILNVEQTASSSEIKRAFRGLSIVLHPDKNSAEDANIQFRNLVSVYETLKDSSKREKYDKVLKDGLPNWKSALYYYRHVRKMGLAEMAALLFVIITIGQYIIAWAAYAEKKYTAESILGSKLKRMQKKNKTLVDIDTILNSIPTPSIFNTLPFQIVKGIWHTPKATKQLFDTYVEYKEEQRRIKELEEEEAENQRILEEQAAKEKEARKEGVRNRKPVFTAKEKTEEELKGYSKLNAKSNKKESVVKPVNSKEPVVTGGLWTDDDLAELIRLVKKYPIGTLSRWDTIADAMNRSVSEVTFMAARLKETGYKPTDSVAEAIIQETAKKVKHVTTQNIPATQKPVNDLFWSQEQQKLLESAIMKCPKNMAGDRWQKIANNVPGKTKEECLARYKHLVELVKAQKAASKETDESAKDSVNIENGNGARKVEKEKEEEDKESVSIQAVTMKNELSGDEGAEAVEVSDLPQPPKKSGGKPRNKRKEKKKRMEFSSDEDDVIDDLE